MRNEKPKLEPGRGLYILEQEIINMRATYWLILINAVVFIIQLLVHRFTELFALDPQMALNGAYWQFFTYMFLHGGITHIAINMFVLLIFGIVVERELGRNPYLALYLASGIGSAFLHLVLTTLQMGFISDIGLIGASGAVFGILAVYGVFFPKNWLFIFPGIPLPAIVAVIGIAGFELLAGITGIEPGIANFGHLGGLIIGAVFGIYWKYFRKKKKQLYGDFEFIWE